MGNSARENDLKLYLDRVEKQNNHSCDSYKVCARDVVKINFRDLAVVGVRVKVNSQGAQEANQFASSLGTLKS